MTTNDPTVARAITALATLAAHAPHPPHTAISEYNAAMAAIPSTLHAARQFITGAFVLCIAKLHAMVPNDAPPDSGFALIPISDGERIDPEQFPDQVGLAVTRAVIHAADQLHNGHNPDISPYLVDHHGHPLPVQAVISALTQTYLGLHNVQLSVCTDPNCQHP